MNKLKLFIEENKEILLILTCAITIIFGLYIFFDRPFQFMGDQVILYKSLYIEWKSLILEAIEQRTIPMYSWNMFLGSDFFSSQFVVSDIFTPIYFLFEDIEHGLLMMVILCIYISSISMNFFLKEFGIMNKNIRIFISLSYALCGWSIVYLGHYMFLRFITFLPLLFYGIEKYLNNKSKFTFVFVVFILFTQCYYFMFPTTLFLLIYGIFTTCNRGYTVKKIVISGLKLIGLYIVGFMLSCFIVLPAIITLVNNPRVGEVGNLSLFWNIITYLGFILSPIVPISQVQPNIFFVTANFHDSDYSIFINIINITSIIYLITYHRKSHKIYVNTMLFLVICWLIKPMSSIFHGFSEASLRWGFLLTFFSLILSAKGLELFDKRKFIKISLIYTSFCAIMTILFFIIGYINISHIIHIQHIVIFILLAFITILVLKYKTKLAFLFCICTMIYSMFIYVYDGSSQYYNHEPTLDPLKIEEFEKSDEHLLYRYNIDKEHLLPTHDLNLNQSLISGYMGVNSYNSLYDTNILDFLHENGIYYHHLELNDDAIMPVLGVKYYIVYDESELPEMYNFNYEYNIDHLEVYSYDEYKGFGYTSENIKYFDELNNLVEMYNTIFVNDNSIDLNKYNDELSYAEFKVYEKGINHFKGSITLNTNNILMIPIPNNNGWKILVNGVETNAIDVNGGFIGIELSSGENNIELYFVSEGFKLGLIITGIGVGILLIGYIYSKFERGNKNGKTKKDIN